MVFLWDILKTRSTMEQPLLSSLPSLAGGKSRPPMKYVDLLQQRREGSDLRWAVREWEPKGNYKYGEDLSREEVFQKVIESDRVKHTISQLVKSGHNEQELTAETESILDQMGHTQDVGTVRQFAFVLPKIMKQIYGKILINEEGIEKIRSTLVETPVVLLPTHRSYADFLLVSYISYHFDLPLPVIAAGMDFLSMAIIGEMLRSSGAFYIRRSFMDSPLYWAVFQEYVQTIVECTGSPLEFFLEGTRSRSGKSLPPKIGLLGCVSESWLRGRLPDIALVPISISYDRTLEEKLYAYELLGVPKPKESTSGLLKATSILKERFGDICIHIGDPISTRNFLSPRIERYLSAGYPSHLAPISKIELSACEALGHHVLRKIQTGTLTSIWSIVSMQLMRVLWCGQWMVPLASLMKEVSWLAGILKNVGGEIAVEGDLAESVRESLVVHGQVASLTSNDEVHIQQVHQTDNQNTQFSQKMTSPSTMIVEDAVTQLMLQHYINQTIHLLIRPALVAQALVSLAGNKDGCPIQELQNRFFSLRTIFSYDFIFEKDAGGKDFMEGLSLITWSGEVSFVQGSVHHVGRGNKLMSLLLDLLRPFITTYTCAAQTLISQEWIDNGALVKAIQQNVEKAVTKSRVYSALSLDSIRHAVRSFNKLGYTTQRKGEDGRIVITPITEKLQEAVSELGGVNDISVKAKL